MLSILNVSETLGKHKSVVVVDTKRCSDLLLVYVGLVVCERGGLHGLHADGFLVSERRGLHGSHVGNCPCSLPPFLFSSYLYVD